MTRSYALVNLKPGVGKSTSAVFLAAALAEAGQDPLFVDADKGKTGLRWDELAGGLGYPVVHKPTKTLHSALPDMARRHGSIVLDVPQVEDHAAIARSACRFADTWVLPFAPAGVEVDRVFADDRLTDFLEDTQSLRHKPARVVVLLNRTNTLRPTRTGPDAEVREVLAEMGWHVLTTQIPQHDGQYRQTFGTKIRAIGTPFQRLLTELTELENGGGA
ncbi:plasmid segregation oscillating ATPase ParF [Streptomyces sp. 2112.2]|uniref:AAA family ATPase n=1 Tax=Streptomyces sp. 2112.2 TaxID=1881024 RepID=UPI000898200F|nr:AAA family ATPase [Streptomyces sp. 2112.2]SEF16552.1 plasmid segregation oscillating ATPase ParF [Streptomyces sp. 2112.2]